jgi:hypothetical protein
VLTRAFNIINFPPVDLAVTPWHNFLSNTATATDDPTAIEYPWSRSLFVYVLDGFLFP